MDSESIALLAAEACDDRKAKDIQLIRVEDVSSLADWIVIAEGFSDVQVRAIAKSVEDVLENKANRQPLRREGINEAKWALIDYGEVIVHLFQPRERAYYSLEAFWSHGERRQFTPTQNTLKT
ncbi:ribosome silencing factor [Prochlorococcus sp. MIT 1341]|uniref:ribosome silencing factor n=1 Tax=Prochlorococcus sp. MIT 1341 TaxID=3096221 RepID=UPI002A748890|nr:ribosome silencing factor [Prochlorococcus sp. MIT 1341]